MNKSMANIQVVMLTIIAAALCNIAFKLYHPSTSTTTGDFMALKDISDEDVRKETRIRIIKSIPIINVNGGQINAEVTGSVSIDRWSLYKPLQI